MLWRAVFLCVLVPIVLVQRLCRCWCRWIDWLIDWLKDPSIISFWTFAKVVCGSRFLAFWQVISRNITTKTTQTSITSFAAGQESFSESGTKWGGSIRRGHAVVQPLRSRSILCILDAGGRYILLPTLLSLAFHWVFIVVETKRCMFSTSYTILIILKATVDRTNSFFSRLFYVLPTSSELVCYRPYALRWISHNLATIIIPFFGLRIWECLWGDITEQAALIW